MDILLIIAGILILLAVLGLTGIIAFLRGAAWLILAFGLIVLVASFVLG